MVFGDSFVGCGEVCCDGIGGVGEFFFVSCEVKGFVFFVLFFFSVVLYFVFLVLFKR